MGPQYCRSSSCVYSTLTQMFEPFISVSIFEHLLLPGSGLFRTSQPETALKKLIVESVKLLHLKAIEKLGLTFQDCVKHNLPLQVETCHRLLAVPRVLLMPHCECG